MQSVTDETFFTGSMRFRSYAGGGGIWQIADSLMRVGTSFDQSGGQKHVKPHPIIAKQKREIPRYWNIKTETGTGPDDSLYTAVNIPGDQDEDLFLDLEVLPNGDVHIKMRNPKLGEMGVQDGTAYLPEESMIFKSSKMLDHFLL